MSRVVGQGAQKYQQIGMDAYAKLIASALQGVEFKSRKAVVVLDLNTGVGESLDAYCMVKVSLAHLHTLSRHTSGLRKGEMRNTKTTSPKCR